MKRGNPIKKIRCEIWKSIPGFPGYEASSYGRIRMLTTVQHITDRRGWAFTRIRKGKILAQSPRGGSNGKRYLGVSIKNKPRSAHRIICSAFHGPPQKEKCCVNHKDGDRKNNKPENLEWVSYSDNEKHAYLVLGKSPCNNIGRPEVREKAIVTRMATAENKRLQIYNAVTKHGLLFSEVAQSFGVCVNYVRQICKRYGV